MSSDVDKVQEPAFAARERGYTLVSHQHKAATGFVDEVTTTIQARRFSVTAWTGSTHEAPFH